MVIWTGQVAVIVIIISEVTAQSIRESSWSSWSCNIEGHRVRTAIEEQTDNGHSCPAPSCQNYSNPSKDILDANTTATPGPTINIACGAGQGVGGIAAIDDELFIVCVDSVGSESSIQVYSAGSNYSYTWSRSISISVGAGDGFTVCASCGYLYLADEINAKIYRIDSTDGLNDISWPASFVGSYVTYDVITIDSDCNIVASSPVLRVFSGSGVFIVNVSLSDPVNGVARAFTAVSVPTGYMVSYKDRTLADAHLGLFDFSGNLLKSLPVDIIKGPRKIIVNNGYMLVADTNGNRIALIDTSLTTVRDFISPIHAIHMWLDELKGILYVGSDTSIIVSLYFIDG